MFTKTIKQDVFEKSSKYWNPGRVKQWQDDGIDLVIGERQGYYFNDLEGKTLMDFHLNGGTYNLGHRNEEIMQTLIDAMQFYDVGNHHFPSVLRAELAETLYKNTPDSLQYTVYSSSGSEAIDVAIKSARFYTQRKKVISVQNAYHGHSGLAVSLGNERYSKIFLSEGDEQQFVKVPFNDVVAMERALALEDVACVVLETIPATYGFPLPEGNYIQEVKQLCEKYGTLYVADEVQTGLMRSGKMWAIEHYDTQPDILVTSKGLGGGIYPIGATVLSKAVGQWMHQDGSAHLSTFGGSELACAVTLKVFDILNRPEVQKNVQYNARYLRKGLERIQSIYPDCFVGIRQLGVIMGLEFNHPEGAKPVMRALYKHGVWAIYSMLDPRVLQLKPGLLIDQVYCDEFLYKMEQAVGEVAKSM